MSSFDDHAALIIYTPHSTASFQYGCFSVNREMRRESEGRASLRSVPAQGPHSVSHTVRRIVMLFVLSLPAIYKQCDLNNYFDDDSPPCE